MKPPFKFPFHTKATHDATVVTAASEPSISENSTIENPVSTNLISANSSTESSGVLALPSAKPSTKFSIRQVSGRAGGAIANLITKNLFFTLIFVSAGIHVAFLLLAPNPLKKTEKPRETDVTSTIPVVTLPPKTPNLNSSKTDLKLPFNPFASRATTPTPNPFANPFNTLNPPSTSYTPSTPDSFQYPLSSPLSVAPLTPDDALPIQSKERNADTRSPVAFVPEDNDYNNDVNDRLIDNTKKPANPTRNTNLKLGVGGNNVVDPSTPGSGQTTTSKNNKEGVLGDSTVGIVLNKIGGGTKIIFTEIAPSSANISASAVEKGVAWIPPKVADANGKQGTVEVALLVAPNGKVEERFFKSSGVAELDKIARETVTAYYDKFQPLKEEEHKGKYRYVKIKYTFPM